MKIGIITEFSEDAVNYGNSLQAYALNYFVRKLTGTAQVETIRVSPSWGISLWTKRVPARVVLWNAWAIFKRKVCNGDGFPEREARRSAFVEFAGNNIPQSGSRITYGEMAQQDYDIYIVGSDVVWAQHRYGINRLKFLDFQGKKPFRRISYAASFGRDWIPEENREAVGRCLKCFDAVSVREKSSVQMLHSMGMEGCVYAVDPTLLLTAEDWEEIEAVPDEVKEEQFVFVYLLGADIRQYREIERVCRKEGLKMAVIPYASGKRNGADREIGDIQVWECSPSNWVWLVHHAEYIVTDSFHGLAFSTIFGKKFLTVERTGSSLGNRLTDYLNTIAQEDKLVQMDEVESFSAFEWDYDLIAGRIAEAREKSVSYLARSLGREQSV